MFAYVVLPLQFKTAFVGETVHIQCGDAEILQNNVSWQYQPRLRTPAIRIISAGHLADDHFEGRLVIIISTLVINKVQADDTGVYTCITNSVLGRHRTYLSVHGKGTMYSLKNHVFQKYLIGYLCVSNLITSQIAQKGRLVFIDNFSGGKACLGGSVG